jgi:hypothetical protein
MMNVHHREWRTTLRAVALGLSITIPVIAGAALCLAIFQANSDFIITIKQMKGYSR